MWTVGRSNFGENDKHPAVMEALERMVEFILKAKDAVEQTRSVIDANRQVKSQPACFCTFRWRCVLTLTVCNVCYV